MILNYAYIPIYSLIPYDDTSHRCICHTHQHANHHHNGTHGDIYHILRPSLIGMAFHSYIYLCIFSIIALNPAVGGV